MKEQVTMHKRIEINPHVCGGKPVIRGTRIPVTVVLDQVASGEAWDSIIRGLPELQREDIQAALRYARESIEHADSTPAATG